MTITTYDLRTFKSFSATYVVSSIALGELVFYTGTKRSDWCCYGMILAIYDESIVVLWID